MLIERHQRGALYWFETDPLTEKGHLVGTNVTAGVQLTGTTEGTRWTLTEITPRQ